MWIEGERISALQSGKVVGYGRVNDPHGAVRAIHVQP
jgi:hypothetical protein